MCDVDICTLQDAACKFSVIYLTCLMCGRMYFVGGPDILTHIWHVNNCLSITKCTNVSYYCRFKCKTQEDFLSHPTWSIV